MFAGEDVGVVLTHFWGCGVGGYWCGFCGAGEVWLEVVCRISLEL